MSAEALFIQSPGVNIPATTGIANPLGEITGALVAEINPEALMVFLATALFSGLFYLAGARSRKELEKNPSRYAKMSPIHEFALKHGVTAVGLLFAAGILLSGAGLQYTLPMLGMAVGYEAGFRHH